VAFVAVLFVAVGMLIELEFVFNNLPQVVALVVAALLNNNFSNAGILRALGDSWSVSLYSGARLAQIGEFSFALASVGLQSEIITRYSYQMTIAVIALRLVLSPAWIAATKPALLQCPKMVV
jgi:CPA2 family monovalent cation:H+ antiporter-2